MIDYRFVDEIDVSCNACSSKYTQVRGFGIAFPPAQCGVCGSTNIHLHSPVQTEPNQMYEDEDMFPPGA